MIASKGGPEVGVIGWWRWGVWVHPDHKGALSIWDLQAPSFKNQAVFWAEGEVSGITVLTRSISEALG